MESHFFCCLGRFPCTNTKSDAGVRKVGEGEIHMCRGCIVVVLPLTSHIYHTSIEKGEQSKSLVVLPCLCFQTMFGIS